MHKFLLFMVLFVEIFLIGCSQDKTGPVEVKWDRDACERCRMVLSDRKHSAQVRSGLTGKVYLFDDIGGAILWLQGKDWAENIKTEIWVNHHKTGDWLNARTAVFISGQNTPMSFGLGAQSASVEGGMNYEQAIRYIQNREQTFNQSGTDLKGQMHHEHQH